MKTVINEGLKDKFKNNKLLFSVIGLTIYGFSIGLISIYSQKYGYVGNFLKILRSNINVPINYLSSFNAEVKPLIIDINHKNVMKIYKTRERALEKGMLIPQESDWVNFKGKFGDKEFDGKLRLKGFLGDHWKRDDGLLSYKINIKNEDTLLGMKRIAIQHPRTRGFMSDWYFQKAVDYVGLISSRYYYNPLIINGKRYPIYQFEENFEKRLIENNKRREGPIFKLFERQFVDEVRLSSRVNIISFYQKNKWQSTPEGQLLMRRAEKLINGYINGEYLADQVFDLELFGKAWALMDLFGHHHALLWGNLRYYLNPVSGLIEPILFDNTYVLKVREKGLLGEQFRHGLNDKVVIDEKFNLVSNPNKVLSQTMSNMLDSEKFSKSYIKNLDEISKKEWLNKFFLYIKSDESNTLKKIYKSYPWYKFDKSILYSNQAYIRSVISPNKAVKSVLFSDNKVENNNFLKLRNNHSLPVEIIGWKKQDSEKIFKFKSSYFLPNKPKACAGYNCFYYISSKQPFHGQISTISFNEFNLEKEMKNLSLVSKVYGTDNLIFDNIYSESESDQLIPTVDNLKEKKFLKINSLNKTISFKEGFWNLNKDLIIPSGYTFEIKEGTFINLQNEALIVSYSPIKFIGSELNPIILESKDSTGQGLVVIDANSTSYIKNVIFKNLGLPRRSGLTMTGSVTFYESDILISNSQFIGNKSEDSLNIIRSKFNIDESLFSSTFSDALDLDFSDGNIQNSKFVDVGNDGIDVSGSEVLIKNTSLENLGDKGISIGEDSKVEINSININKSVIGLACKDSSEMKAKKIFINKSLIGLATYQKKSEYGPCSGQINNIEFSNNKRKFLIEKNSEIEIDGKPLIFNSRNVYKELYGDTQN